MLLKALFLILIVYLILRTVMNLFRAVWREPRGNERISEVPPVAPPPRHAAPAARSTGRKYQVEVEDAQWVDVEAKNPK